MKVVKGNLALACLVLALGCNTQAKWTYPTTPQDLYRSPSGRANLTVAVLPFSEERPTENQSATFLLYMVPLVPYGWVTYERPEAAKMFNTIVDYQFQVDEDLGKAATRSLEQSGLVKRAYFTLGGETREADFVLRGSAYRTLYEGRTYSYLLGPVGPLLWWFGLPAGSSENAITFVLSLRDQDDREVWTYRFQSQRSMTQGMYYNWGADVANFPVLMEEGMNAALQDLAPELPRLEDMARHRSPAP